MQIVFNATSLSWTFQVYLTQYELPSKKRDFALDSGTRNFRGDTVMQLKQLQYESPTVGRPTRGSPRFWAVTFVVSGLVALGCVPAVFVFEHFGWWEAPVHGTSFCACVVCVLGAGMYLLLVGRRADRAMVLGFRTRTLAYTAVALAGGFLLLAAGILVLMAITPNDL